MEKICSICKVNKCIDEFHKDKSTYNGHKCSCKECSKLKSIQKIKEKKIIRMYKQCYICKINKDISCFYKDKRLKDGLCGKCKECVKLSLESKKDYIKESDRKRYYYKGGKEKNRKRYLNLKMEVMSHYGNYCVCCGESNLEFLTIDHVNDDGNIHRKEIHTTLYRWLKNNNFPKDRFQILCWNCNEAKSKHGECPHQKQLREIMNK